MHVKLPEGAVSSEFVLQHGMIDAVVHRRDLRQTLARLLRLYCTQPIVKMRKIKLQTREIQDGLRP
jgi:acetyl-CoA carboxylase beta subunit